MVLKGKTSEISGARFKGVGPSHDPHLKRRRKGRGIG